MNLNDLLKAKDLDPKQVLVLRHKPKEPSLDKVLPWLASERHDLFDAFQQTQGLHLESTMKKLVGVGHIASFIRRGGGKALFVGLYSIESNPLTYDKFWKVPAHRELKALGMKGFSGNKRSSIHQFQLSLTKDYSQWKGKLVIDWPKSRAWWRRAHKREFPILAILEDSALDTEMPEWNQINFTWEELKVLPTPWKAALKEWRGIYYIFDKADGKGYVGVAYGKDNLLGRWLNYAARGHGGNRLLRPRNPQNFLFSILQRVSPDTEDSEVIQLEQTWKIRLHTHNPSGLNDN